MAMVEAASLVRYYGRRRALDGVGFSIERGEIVGILGLNGAGKSTLLRILAGLLMPSAGTVKVGGVDVLEAPAAARRKVGFLPEEPPLYREMRVADYLRFTGRLKGMRPAEVDKRIPEVCDATGLDAETRARVIDELSHGYKKRVGIAQAILHDPDLVILDEPISGLDPRQIVDMRRTIDGLRGKHTVLVSSHILSEISQTCDRILLIHDGRVVAEGSEDALAAHLGAGLRLVLVVRGDQAALESHLAGRQDVSAHRIADAGHGRLEARVTLDGDDVEALVSALVGAGFGVRRVAEEAGELEQVFLDLTRSKKEAA